MSREMEGASVISDRIEAGHFDPAFDAEQAGIVCDRLASELLHASRSNPGALRSLRLDARDVLACTSAWLDCREAARVPTFPEEVYDTPDMLAGGLRALADHLLELADQFDTRGRP